MAPRSLLIVTVVLLCLTLGLISQADSQKACCTRYNRKPIPFRRIIGYREQPSTEICNMEAIIFFTVKKQEVCVTRKDLWVQRIMDLLSLKLKQMSKSAEAQMKKSVNPSFNDGSGSFSSTTESLPISTEGFDW